MADDQTTDPWAGIASPAQAAPTGGGGGASTDPWAGLADPVAQPASKKDLAEQAMDDPSLGRSLGAHLTAYGANAASQIPGLKEAASAIDATTHITPGETWSDRYNAAEANQKAMREAGWEKDKVATGIGDTGATLLGAGATGAGTAKVAAKIAPGAADAAAEFAAAHPYIAAGATGAGQGAVQGFARGDDTASRLADAGVGAVTGAGVGPAATLAANKVVGPVAGRVASYLRDVRGVPEPEPSLEQALSPEQKGAWDIVKKYADSEGKDPKAIAEQLRKDPDATPLDVLTADEDKTGSGRSFYRLANAAATYPGDARKIAGDVSARGMQAGDRIGEAFDQHMSDNPFYTTLDDAEARGDLAAPHYKEFYSQNQNMQSPLIDNLLSRPAGQEALSRVATKLQNRTRRLAVPDPELNAQARDAGMFVPGGVSSGLKGETLDLVKRELDKMANNAKNGAAMGQKGADYDFDTYSGMSQDMRDEMDRLDVTAKAGPNSFKPEGGAYAQARAKSAVEFQMKDALTQGRNFTSNNTDPEEIAAFMNDENTSEPQKAAFLSGMRRKLQNMADKRDADKNPITMYNTPDIKKRIVAALGEDKAQPVLDTLDREATQHKVNQSFFAGSNTVDKAQGVADIEGKAPLSLGNAIKGVMKPKDTAISAIDSAQEKRASKASQARAGEIMKLLTKNDPDAWEAMARYGQGTGNTPMHVTISRPASWGSSAGAAGQVNGNAQGGAIHMQRGGRVYRPKSYPLLEHQRGR